MSERELRAKKLFKMKRNVEALLAQIIRVIEEEEKAYLYPSEEVARLRAENTRLKNSLAAYTRPVLEKAVDEKIMPALKKKINLSELDTVKLISILNTFFKVEDETPDWGEDDE